MKGGLARVASTAVPQLQLPLYNCGNPVNPPVAGISLIVLETTIEINLQSTEACAFRETTTCIPGGPGARKLTNIQIASTATALRWNQERVELEWNGGRIYFPIRWKIN